MRKVIIRVAALLCAAALVLVPLTVRALDLETVARVASDYRNPSSPKLEAMFRAALLDTQRDITMAPDGTAYVKTGDIPAEWLRDASAEARPYLYFAKDDPAVRKLLRAVIARMAKYLQIDPYANAFTLDYKVWEEKFELDSLAYPIIFAWTYWKVTGDASIFTDDFSKGLDAALNTMEIEQDHPRNSHYTHKELPDNGKGNPVKYTGMIWTGFRPSDDACVYNYLIPSEMMAVVALGDMEEIERVVYRNLIKAQRAKALRTEVNNGIQEYGLVFMPNYGYVYAYEVDGLGHAVLMDDANIPSLLSAPYIGYTKATDTIYQNTRRYLLSKDNPYYYSGTVAHGIGSAHTNDGWVWPLALVMQGLTATTQSEKRDVLNELLASDTGDHVLHESFNPNDPTKFTRADFGWPNALFSEFVMTAFDGYQPLPTAPTGDLEILGE
jgi:meiotically up-regulated gene 157 (Mug157) protein